MSVNRFRSYELKAKLAEKESKITQLEAERERLREENERLNATPARVVEWKRQEVVATAGAAIEIIGELTTKLGVVYANVAAIQGVFVNKAALNMSARTQRELAVSKDQGQGGGDLAA